MTEEGPLWLAAFVLQTNLRVAETESILSSRHGPHEIHLSNVRYDKSGTYYLDLKVQFRAAGIEAAHEAARELAEEICHTMSFVSEASVRVQRPIYLINWERGVKDRDMYAYGKHEFRDPIDAIDSMFLRSVDAVSNHQTASSTRAALRWYSRGNRASVLEDRFMYYWFVLEVLAGAENIVGTVIDKCPRCRQELTCSNPECGHPEHRPYEGQRIGILLQAMGMSGALVRGVKEVRNLLSHGEDRAGIVRHMKKQSPEFELEKAVDIMGNYAQGALHRALDLPPNDPPLTFYHLEERENLTLMQRSHLRVQTKGDPLNPGFDDVWLPQLSMILTDPDTGEEERFGADGRPIS